MKNVWAVVCGIPRIEFDFYNTLAYLCGLRKDGRIDGIVWSTWSGESLKYKHIISELNICVVESPEVEDSPDDIWMCFSRQATQIHAALSVLPCDVFVLKCRTDFTNFEMRKTAEYLEEIESLSERRFGSFETGMKYRTAVFRFPIDRPLVLLRRTHIVI